MRAIYPVGVALLAMIAAAPSWAASGCTIRQAAELPVTMDGMGPMIDAKINGTPVRLIADSGAFLSILSPGSAQTLHLSIQSLPFADIQGIGGSASVGVTRTKTFSLAGIDLPALSFLVGGSEVHAAGVIGQDILGFADVEYDLPHGVIRLMRSQDCGTRDLAYWAAGRSYSVVKIDPRNRYNPHTVGTVTINGKPVRATFDTGASTTLLSMAAAARLGLRPGGPGVTDGGSAMGVGHKLERTWIAPVDSIAIGDGEQIQHARIRFGSTDSLFDILIGADFFIAHRVYVDNSRNRLFLTYEGGPIFNLKARYEGPTPPGGADAPVATAASSGPTTDAAGLSREGAVALARDDPDTAIADFTKAIAAAPAEPRYREQRAEAYFRQNKAAPAMTDLNEAIRLAPEDVETRIGRAAGLLRQHDKDAALADLEAADRAADPAAMQRLALGHLFIGVGQPQRAIPQFDQWLKAHPADARKPEALNDGCWARALAGQDLDTALRDCNAALRAMPGTPGFLDSRGLVKLRLGALDDAKSDFDTALARQPRLPWSLYGRGLIRQRSGDAAGGKADIAAAVAIRPDIAEEATRYGITL